MLIPPTSHPDWLTMGDMPDPSYRGDLGRRRWSRFAVFLVGTLLLAAVRSEWILVLADLVLAGCFAGVLAVRAPRPDIAGWPSVRRGWPGSYPAWLAAALLAGLAAAYLAVPAELLTPLLALAAAYLLLPSPGETSELSRREVNA